MKKFLIFILVVAAGYFAYEYLIREKPVLEVDADKVVTTASSMDIEAPTATPLTYGSVQGTVKNVSDRKVTGIVLKYIMDGKPLNVEIYSLEPGETRAFSTDKVIIRGAGSSYHLEEMIFN